MCWFSNDLVMLSTVSPFKEDLSRQYQLLNLTLKSPIITTKKGLFWSSSSKVLSKFSENCSNSSWVWLRHLYKEIKLQSLSPIFNSKLILSCKWWILKTLKANLFLIRWMVRSYYTVPCDFQITIIICSARVKVCFGNAYYIKFLSCDISFKEWNFGIAMKRYAV